MRHPWRVVIVVAILAAALSMAAIAIDSAVTTTEAEDPIPAVETVVPGPAEILQDAITADLRVNLTGVLVIDGVEVPEDQTDRVVALGQVSFRPGPGKEIVRFEPGTHTVTVLFWERGKERPANPESYTWTFRSVS
ncbi:MAG: hypothetical protein FJW86_07875 [Actinobacteria bacterium]|nr:hypothetical protein [Actinomycetota bacterium]